MLSGFSLTNLHRQISEDPQCNCTIKKITLLRKRFQNWKKNQIENNNKFDNHKIQHNFFQCSTVSEKYSENSKYNFSTRIRVL